MIVLCVLRAFYTSLNVTWALGIVVPAIWYFGMLGLVATAATRKSLAGFTVGTAFLLMSIAGQQLDPVRLDSYSGQRDLVNFRLLGEANWLIAKVYFLVMTFILAFLVVRIGQGQRTRIHGALAAIMLVVIATTGTHWLWARPVPLLPAADPEVIDVREEEDSRRIRIAISTVEEKLGKRVENTLIEEERYTRAGDQWVFQSSSFFHPSSETDLIYEGGPVEFTRRHNLVDVILPTPVKPGDHIALDLTCHGPLDGIAEGVSTDFIALFDHWYPATRDRTQNWVYPFTCRLEVHLPNPWQLAGATIIDKTANQSVFTWASTVPIHRPPLCAGIFRNYETQFRDIPVTVQAFTLDEAYAQRLLATCVDILGVHEGAFGPHPHARLAFVENRFQNASGVAHPGMMTLRADRTVDEQEDEMSDVLLPHEIAHQWWRLGLPKGLAEGGAVYANFCYLDLRRDRRTAVAFLTDKLYPPYMNSSSAIETLVTDYANRMSMYTRGAYLFVHLEFLVGRDGLSRALRNFLDRHLQASLVDEEAINRDCEQVLQAVAGEGLHFVGNDRNLYASLAHPGRIGGNEWTLNAFDGQWHGLVPDPERESTILAIARSREGTMWYGGYGSLWRVDEQQTTLWILKEQRLGRVGAGRSVPRAAATSTIPGSDVFALQCDRGDDNLWVGTDHGVSALNATDGSWRHFAEAEGLGGTGGDDACRG